MMSDAEQARVLVVDDTPENIHILMGILEDEYDLLIATNGEKALNIAMMSPMPDLILLDIMMPGMDGYEVCSKLKADPQTANIPVIFVTTLSADENEARGLDLGAVDYIAKPFNPALVKARVTNHLKLKKYSDELIKYSDQLEEMVKEKTKELLLTRDVTIEALGTLAEYRDPETGGHIKRTMNYVRLLAERLQSHPRFREFLTASMIENLWKSAPLHDVGKVGVPDSILLKPGKLTPEEFEEIKKHTIYGRDALNVSAYKLGPGSFLSIAQEMAYTHHEKWNGSGYPQGLKGTEIPVPGRLMAVADVYDALISQRVYKPAFPHEKAVEIIKEDSGKAFDPDVVSVFLEFEDEFRRVAEQFVDNSQS